LAAPGDDGDSGLHPHSTRSAGRGTNRVRPQQQYCLHRHPILAILGGKIVDHVGAFIQGTYDQVGNSLHWDNTDIRYAHTREPSGKELVYGICFNNYPTVEDIWNSTPAWGYPYLASELAPTPVAKTLTEGGLAQQVLGLNPYIYWDRLVYFEVGGYCTLSPGQLSALGIPPPGTSPIDGLAPSWRLAVEPAWDNNTCEVGTFGLAASLVPQRITGAGTDHFTDIGFDTQYEFLGARDSFSLQARYITEYQNLGASQALGFCDEFARQPARPEYQGHLLLQEDGRSDRRLFRYAGKQ
jgi:hypothetical protein